LQPVRSRNDRPDLSARLAIASTTPGTFPCASPVLHCTAGLVDYLREANGNAPRAPVGLPARSPDWPGLKRRPRCFAVAILALARPPQSGPSRPKRMGDCIGMTSA
jgi:hypothetical protein